MKLSFKREIWTTNKKLFAQNLTKDSHNYKMFKISLIYFVNNKNEQNMFLFEMF